jgi:hypothetical protein
MDLRILCLLLFLNKGLGLFTDLLKEFDLKPLLRGVRDRNAYIKARNDVLLAETNMRIGHDLVLNSREQIVNEKLMQYKTLEINESRVHGKPFPPNVNFLVGKPLVEKSKVFQMIKLMPKGRSGVHAGVYNEYEPILKRILELSITIWNELYTEYKFSLNSIQWYIFHGQMNFKKINCYR